MMQEYDKCFIPGGLSNRNTDECLGDFCDFCGKFTETYREEE